LAIVSGYYAIASIQGLKDLLGFADNASYKFRLTGNIDLAGASGFWIPYFAAAEFDGTGHTISNLNVNVPFAEYVGMFGQLSDDSTVSKLGLVGGSMLGACERRRTRGVEQRYDQRARSGTDGGRRHRRWL
jgi:hypothetical protein